MTYLYLFIGFHTPEKPSDMEHSLYQLGARGAGSSNVGAGYSTINSSIVDGYMEVLINDKKIYGVYGYSDYTWVKE